MLHIAGKWEKQAQLHLSVAQAHPGVPYKIHIL